MPVRKERQMMRRLKQIYIAIFLLTLLLLSLFLLREQAARGLDQQLQMLNVVRQDFDAGTLHLMLADKNLNQWQNKIGMQLFGQSVATLTELMQKHQSNDHDLHDATLQIKQKLQQFLTSPPGSKAEASQEIFALRMQMESLHLLYVAALQAEYQKSRYWFTGLLTSVVVLITGLFLALLRNEAKREKFHRQLYTTQHQLALIAENIDEVFWLQDAETDQVLYVSAAFEQMWQLPKAALTNNPDAWLDKVHPDDKAKVQERLAHNKDQPKQLEYRVVLQDGQIKWIHDRIFPVSSLNEDGVLKKHIVAVATDITATKKLNEQLMISQKMESLGKLTGGIAHDFNNLLTVIMGNAQLLTELTPKESQLSSVAGLIVKVSERGATLNRQLLAFASKQYLKPERTNVAELLQEMMQLLQRSIGENISIQFQDNNVRSCCYVDAGQLQNAIINLCINAKDAMPAGGRILLKLALTESNDFAVLEVTDSGEGIADEILPHIFEPFFSTKTSQKGSGLGLSMVYGFVKQSGGDIQVNSVIGTGTTFRLLLPVCQSDLPQPGQDTNKTNSKHRLLLVEDDGLVRDSVVHMLKGSNYEVVSAENGDEGLQLLKLQPDFEIMLTDVVMPGSLNGIELAEIAKAEYPALNILLMSGYVGKLSDKSANFASFAFLPKPFSKSQLLKALMQLVANKT